MDEILIGDASRIQIGRGILEPAIASVFSAARPAVAAVLTQEPAADHARRVVRALESAGIRVELNTLPEGEACKELAVATETYRWMAGIGLGRRDVVVGVGGGTVTDLAGFVAATWLRGVRFVGVPTTLLGAVDAAVGGKTGVNLDGKNLVGAFHHPTDVVIDVDTLETLPPALRREGLAESVKCGLIADVSLLELLERDREAADLEQVVRAAVAVKAGVVERDFREAGEREILNYGHTIGHGIEVAGNLRHGHAIAIGMVAAGAAAAELSGFADEERQRDAIAGLGLPVSAPPLERAAVERLIAMDKKRTAEGLRMVLLEAVGRPQVVVVDAATVDIALAAIGIA